MSEPSSQPTVGHMRLPELDRVRPTPARASPPVPDRPGDRAGGSSARGGRGGSGQTPPADAPPSQHGRPTPPAPPSASSKPVPDAPAFRRFSADGVEWLARAAGHGSGGGVGRACAPLMLLTFEVAGASDGPVKEVLHVGRDLSSLSDGELAELLERAAPFTRSVRRQALFSETRVGKKGER